MTDMVWIEAAYDLLPVVDVIPDLAAWVDIHPNGRTSNPANGM